MDKLDYLILSELLKDASLPFVTISQRVGASPYTVRRRFEKLKKGLIVNNCIASIDMSKLGYQGKLFSFITIASEGDKALIISQLSKIRNIFITTELMAPFDILSIAFITDLRSIQEIVEQIKKIPFVQHVKIACIDNSEFPLSPNFGSILSEKSRSLAIPQREGCVSSKETK